MKNKLRFFLLALLFLACWFSFAFASCKNDCQASSDALRLIMKWEGFAPVPYKDIAGHLTYAYGHKIEPGIDYKFPVTPDEAEEILRRDVVVYANGVNRLAKVRLMQNQFDALTSFTYNLGISSLRRSTLIKRVNAGRHDEVPKRFLDWNKARINGILQPVRGLTLRRLDEADMYAGH